MSTWGRKGVLSNARARLAVGAIVVVASVMPAGAALDNKGKDFILSFTPNFDRSGVRQVHLASDVAASVTIQYPVNLPSFTPDVVSNNAIHVFAADDSHCKKSD